jgi:DnaJ-class molecular chaperone
MSERKKCRNCKGLPLEFRAVDYSHKKIDPPAVCHVCDGTGYEPDPPARTTP